MTKETSDQDNSKYYELLEKIKGSSTFRLHPCKFINPEVKLRPYQHTGVGFMLLNQRCLLGDATGTGKCSVGDTKILTNRGIVSLFSKETFGDLFAAGVPSALQEDTFYDPPRDLHVYLNGEKEVSQVYYGGKKPTIKFTTDSGLSGHCTQNHRWLTKSLGTTEWKDSSSIEVGDYIAIGNPISPTSALDLPADICWALGRVIGSSTKGGSQSFSFRVVSSDMGVVDRIEAALHAARVEVSLRVHSSPVQGSPLEVEISLEGSGDGALRKLFRLGDEEPWGSKVPAGIFLAKNSCVGSFLKGVFEACGHVTGSEVILDLTSKPDSLLEDLTLLLVGFGVKPSDLSDSGGYLNITSVMGDDRTDLGLNCHKILDWETIKRPEAMWTQVLTVEDGGIQDVFDISVPDGNAYIANGMVSHNTLQSVSTYGRLLENDLSLRYLVVTIKSAIYQWANEFRKFAKDLKVMVLDADTYADHQGKRYKAPSKVPTDAFRKQCLDKFNDEGYHVLVLAYSTMVLENNYIVDTLSKDKRPYMVTFDEATAFKSYNPESHYKKKQGAKPKDVNSLSTNKREYLSIWQAAYNISTSAKMCYGLSATPIKNRLEEAFAIYAVIRPGIFKSLSSFRAKFCVYRQLKIGKRIIPQFVQYKNLGDFSETIKPHYIGRSKRDVAQDLPCIITKNVVIQMGRFQKKKYEEALEGLLVMGDGDEKSPETLAKLSYCQAISNTPYLIGFEDQLSSKEEELKRLIDEELCGKKVIVYTNSREWISKLHKEYENSLKITGDVSGVDRQKAMDLFTEDERYNLIFINKAGIESINLQAAGTIICLDLPWSYGDYLQLVGRAQRIGSTYENILMIHIVNEGTIDEYKLQILLGKKDLVDKVFGPDSERMLKNLVEEDLKTMIIKSMRYNSLEKVKNEGADLLDLVDISSLET